MNNIDIKDIKIVELSKRDMEGYNSSRLVLEISNVVFSEMNALRRICYKDIPTYAFDPSTIDIEYNDTIFNNDMMRLRLSNLPILNIDTEVEFLQRKYWDKVDFTDTKIEKHPKNKKIDCYINVHNDTLKNMNIFTDSLRISVDGSIDNNMYKNIEPILLIKLRPNESFKARMKAVLAIGELSDIYSGVSISFYKMIDENRFKFTLESQGQMKEYDLLIKSCDICIKKLNDIKKNVEKNMIPNEKNEYIEIKLINEDNTLGNLIGDALQNHKDVNFASPTKPDQMVKEIIIKYYTKNKDKIKVFNDAINTKIKVFNTIKDKLKKLN